jgi:arabinofuranosyltransferase
LAHDEHNGCSQLFEWVRASDRGIVAPPREPARGPVCPCTVPPVGVDVGTASAPAGPLTRHRWATGTVATAVAVAVAIVIAGILIAVPLVDGQTLASYTADDSYISFRYSDNLANGHGPVWNTVGPRADGYTSALWMALVAVPTAVGADPAVAAKVLGLLAGALIVLVLGVSGGRRAPLARAVAIGALVLSPAFLTLTVQGLETTLAALMATLAAWTLVRTIRSPSNGNLAAFNVACLLAVLTRPDTIPYVTVCLIGLGAWLLWKRDRAVFLRALAWTAGALLLPGAVWALWRWSYYGYPLPNTAYAKRSDQLIDAGSRHNVKTFVTTFAWPYLLAIAVLAVRAASRARRQADPGFSWAIGVALCASLAFLFTGLFFSPIQGDLWRFQMPVFPVLLLCGVLLAARDDGASELGLRGRFRVLPWIAAAALAAFALTSLGTVRTEVRGRWTYDRVQAGKALAPFAHDGLTMFITESGAIPYYSGWRAHDLLGLNDHFIAQHGARAGYVAALNPALLQFVIKPGAAGGPPYDVFRQLLGTGRYELASATVKTNADLKPGGIPQAHFYFVRRDARRAAEIVAALRGMPRVLRLPPGVTDRTATLLGYSK